MVAKTGRHNEGQLRVPPSPPSLPSSGVPFPSIHPSYPLPLEIPPAPVPKSLGLYGRQLVPADFAAHSRAPCWPPHGAASAQVGQISAAGDRLGSDIPIEHVIFVMQENRSFDHYFSELTHGEAHTAAASVTMFDRDGAAHPRVHAPRLCSIDPRHDWDSVHEEWNNGAMDGFARPSNDGRTMIYYGESDLPFM